MTKILAMVATKDCSSQKQQIEMLSRMELKPKEIAELLGTTSNTVSVVLATMRKGKKQRKKGDK